MAKLDDLVIKKDLETRFGAEEDLGKLTDAWRQVFG